MSLLDSVEPVLLWKYFDAIRKIPRPSGKEQAAADYVISVAKQLGLEYERDDLNNVLVRKPASPGHENAPTIVLQSHLDMVCEKNSDKEFDFDTQEIELVRDGEWLKANGTTLGADNGIGVAAILAILEDNTLVHGPLEALFTADEERGLDGAKAVSEEWLKGRTLLNLDSEELGVFSIGCAGGRDTNLALPVKRVEPQYKMALKISLQGLRGGHSGIDINEGRGNALKILNHMLYRFGKQVPFQLVSFSGGDKHNAIPREAFAEILIDPSRKADLDAFVQKWLKDIEMTYQPVEQNISCLIKELEKPSLPPLDKADLDKLIALLAAIPHGVLDMSRTIKGLVETSNNLAALRCEENSVKILTSSRSSNMNALQDVLDTVINIANLAGASSEQPPGYPGWMPNLDSKVLHVALDTYKQVTGEKAKYEAIHAGLECGLIGEKFPGMDMISVGPTLQHPHSPDERVHIGTVKTFYDHVVKMLEALA